MTLKDHKLSTPFPQLPEPGRFRIAVNTHAWKETTNNELSRALALLDETEETRILKYRALSDQKQSLIGRLILNAMCCHTLNLPNSSLIWHRTDRNKPYLDASILHSSSPAYDTNNFTYNVSHSGHWVVGASELSYPIGIDVSDHGIRPSCRLDYNLDPESDFNENLPVVAKHLKNFDSIFSNTEKLAMKRIRMSSSENQMIEFSRFWTSKESYVKTEGLGLNLDVSRLAFDFSSIPNDRLPTLPSTLSPVPITVSLDNTDESADWSFEQFILDQNHLCTVAVNTQKRDFPQSTPLFVVQPSQLIHFLETFHGR
ncbi:putative 4'-phosphopantetheinyl transferase superfamily protein [Blattamonas nauphoetae]|uniref:holo-[acyl-carrier-protein] synthase n=1 Tax=Blattamonas nauphoetae TaxID=2049346 RepID=A0ABQ9Y6I1_9EUKA|nr:putative 4'-phosphopantetheinyl transferase superfamily protein [Blattamonas nauphoetae]